jgi:hypothetical protein
MKALESGSSSAAQHDDLRHVRLREHLECVVGNVGLGQLFAGEREHAGHVRGHVAVSDDHRPLG